MTEHESAAYQRLEAMQDQLEGLRGANSRGIRDLATSPLSSELLADIRTCISSDDSVAIGTGLYVLQGLLLERDFDWLPDDFKVYFVSRVRELLRFRTSSIVYSAIDWFAKLHSAYPEYRQRMLQFLASEDLGSREIALKHFRSYCQPGEVTPLLAFQNDDFASQKSPLGDWEYVLRNRALVLAEQQVGQTLVRELKSEEYQGARVTWYDWTPFINWLARKEGGGT